MKINDKKYEKKTHDKHYVERTVLGLVNPSFNLSSFLLFLI